MKLTVVFLTVVSLGISARSFSQPITYNGKHVSLEKVFSIIQQQTGYTFFYNDADIAATEAVTVSFKDVDLRTALDKLLKGQHLSYTIQGKTIFVHESTGRGLPEETMVGEIRHIRGIVSDSTTGKPLVGVTIKVRGSTTGTVTDANGAFSLEVPDDAVLVISYLGYNRKEIALSGRVFLHISLAPATTGLNQVVVTALGLKKVEAGLGYSIDEISGKVFNKVRTDKLWDRLNGKVAGLRINSRSGVLQDAGVTLRGRTPLFVVNGNPVEHGFRAISQDDIESITVLKGPQASVLYGSRGIDGAIIITTKSSGNSKDLEISINSSTMMSVGYLTLPKTQSIYGQGEFGQYAYKDGKGGGLYDDIWIWGPKLDQKDPNTPSGYWETPQYNSPIDAVTGERIPTPWRSHPDNLRKLLRSEVITNNSLSVSQKLDKGGYRIGLNQMFRQGMIPNTNVNQLGINMAGDYTIVDRLHFKANLNYSNLFTHNYPPVGYSNNQVYYNTVLYMGANTDIDDLKNYWIKGKEGYEQYNFNHVWFQNPWFLAYEYLQPYSKKRVIASASLDYDLGKNTNFMLKGGQDRQFTVNEFDIPYAEVNGETGGYSVEEYSESSLDVNAIFTTRQQFGDFDLDFMAGGNWNELVHKNLTGKTVGGLIVPGVYNLTNSKNQATVSNYLTRKRMFGLYGSATLAWRSAIYLGLTGRNDWSSALIKGNRSYFYPSVSLSTIVSNLIHLPEPVSFLKLRGAWVKVGRDQDAYQLSNSYYLSRVWGNSPAFAPQDLIIDPDIMPSITTSYEFGVDLGFHEDRYRINFTYFNTLDKQWIQQVNIPVTVGYANMLTNGNAYLRLGYEVKITAKPVVSHDFNWQISGNWFTFETILNKIYNGLAKYGNLEVGDRTDAFYAKVYMREPGTGKFIVGNNGLPVIDNFARDLGNKDPKWEAGLSNTFTYKNWSLGFEISGRIGGLIYSQLNARMIETGADPRTAVPDRELDWKQTAGYIPKNAVIVTSGKIEYDPAGNIINDTREFAPDNIPVMFKDWMRRMGSLGGQMTKGWNVYDASFVKLRSAALTYNFDDLLAHNRTIKAASVSLIGENLLMWKKLPNEDPDADYSSLGYPTQRYLGLNLSVTF